MNLWKPIDRVIDSITMYRLVIYYLAALLIAAGGLSLFGGMHYNPWYIALSTGILIAACWVTNKVFAYVFEVPINDESTIITALILALIITPKPTGYNILFLLAASGLAIASKYILTIRKRHVFNPAAIAVILTALGSKQTASWWIGTAVMLPFVLLGGILIIRKVRREKMLLYFFASTTLATIVYALLGKTSVYGGLHAMVLSSAVFFLGFVMLTEPLTSPPTVKKQAWYAAIVGVLLPPQVHFFNFYSSPELALLAGNIFSYIVSPKAKLFPTLRQKIKVADDTVDFVFAPGQKFSYKPGQYLEFTLPHRHIDLRGSRRYFTLASSPTESDLRIGVKFYDRSSSFKRGLLDMDEKTPVVASQLAGDFVMPDDPSEKLAFIAGGIGVTPFRSMIKYLVDTDERRDVSMLYSARTEADFAYKDVFEEAREQLGMRTVYAVTGAAISVTSPHTVRSSITPDLLKRTMPDYLERTFYISGTHPMVEAIRSMLIENGVSHHRIRTDFFPGLA